YALRWDRNPKRFVEGSDLRPGMGRSAAPGSHLDSRLEVVRGCFLRTQQCVFLLMPFARCFWLGLASFLGLGLVGCVVFFVCFAWFQVFCFGLSLAALCWVVGVGFLRRV